MLRRKGLVFARLFFILSLTFLMISGSAQALDIYQQLDSPFYDPDSLGSSGGSCNVTVSANLSGNDNIQKAYNFFTQYMTSAQAAGIVGNFVWESGVSPTTSIGGSQSNTPTDVWGIAQWTAASGRISQLEAFAQQHNENIDDLATQLDFSWFEFQTSHKQDLSDLKQQTTPEAAADVIYNEYEGAGGDGTGPNREDAAHNVYNKYNGSTGTTVSAPGNSCSSIGPGQNSQFLDGFTVYDQYDPAWASLPYGTSTIASSGCGPSAMAMIITALTGQAVTPDMTTVYANSQGLYIPKAGSSWSIAPVLAQHWGLTATAIGADMAKITATLQNGGLVIASGEGPLPFTSDGHYIVIRAVTIDGQWKIGDSGHNNTSSQNWDPQSLITSMNGGSVYAITK